MLYLTVEDFTFRIFKGNICRTRHFEQSEKILAIRKKYYKRYSEFLTKKQIMRVYEIEEKMMRTLKEVKEHQRRKKIETEKRETMKKRAERGK